MGLEPEVQSLPYKEPERESGTGTVTFPSVRPGCGAQCLGKHQLDVTVKVFCRFNNIYSQLAFYVEVRTCADVEVGPL